MRVISPGAALVAVTLAAPVYGASFEVPSDNFPTIQSALNFATNGDEIVLTASLYAGPGNRDLDFRGRELTVRSESGDPAQCTIDCGGSIVTPHRAFIFNEGEGADAIVQGLTIINAWHLTGGAIHTSNGASPTIRDCIVTGSYPYGVRSASGAGFELERVQVVASARAGIRLAGSGDVDIANAVIAGNGEQGLVVAGRRKIIIRNSEIRGNAREGIRFGASDGGKLTLTASVLAGNGRGGLWTADTKTDVTIEESTIAGNSAPAGGGVYAERLVKMTIEQSIIWGNCGTDTGAEVFIDSEGDDDREVVFACSIFDPARVVGTYLDDGGNIAESPRFCAAAPCDDAPTTAGEYTVELGSPALVPEGACAPRIGARPAACGAACTVSPPLLEFGEVEVGSSVEQSFTIENTGLEGITGEATLSCEHFAITGGTGAYDLAPGETSTVTVAFLPTASGEHACDVTTGSVCGPVLCVGTGTLQPACQITPTELEFGTVTVGSSSDRSLTVTNVGGGLLTGTLSAPCEHFEIAAGAGDFALGAGESLEASIRFAPTAPGEHSCSIESGGTCTGVPATGVGEPAPSCATSVSSLDFGTVIVGDAASLSFQIENVGGGTLIGNVSESCPEFTLIEGEGEYALGTGETHAVIVRFEPTTGGPHACTIETGAGCDVPASGVGDDLPSCATSETSLDFGIVAIGEQRSLSFDIENVGGGTLIGNVSESCPQFTLIAGAGSYALGAGETHTVTVRYQPTSTGTHACDVATGLACSSVSCSGVAVTPPTCVASPDMIDFGSVVVGASLEASFVISNEGSGQIAGSIESDCPSYSILSGGGSYVLDAGQELTVTVRFAPTAVGVYDCALEIGDECSEVTLTGSATPLLACDVSPTQLDFGEVQVGAFRDHDIDIQNLGSETLSIDVRASCSQFALVSGGGSHELLPGEALVVTLRYAPRAGGPHACAVSVGSECADVVATGLGDASGEPTTLPVPPIPRSVYRLLSLPVAPDTDALRLSSVFAPLFGAEMDSSTWLGWALSGSTPVPDPLLPAGQGFWLRSEIPLLPGATVSGAVVTSAVIPLEPGWNIVGTPDIDDVPLTSLRIRSVDGVLMTLGEAAETGAIARSVFDYVDSSPNGITDGEWHETRVWDTSATLEPWRGRLMHAYARCQLRYGFPSDVARTSPTETARGAADWEVTVAATNDDGVVRRIEIGAASTALTEWDVEDAPQPPLPSNGFAFGVDHGDWPFRPDTYVRSIAFAGETLHEWPLSIVGAGERVTLSWEGVGALPEGLDAVLVRPDGLAVSMLETTSYTLRPAGGVATSRIRITTEPHEGTVLDASDRGITRLVPMPLSGDDMRIVYTVPRAVGNARMRVFDIRGRLIRDLGAVPGGVGDWAVRWDGRDDGGRRVGSGQFLIQLTLGRQVHSTHQVVVR